MVQAEEYEERGKMFFSKISVNSVAKNTFARTRIIKNQG
jgi:hypothetical protein